MKQKGFTLIELVIVIIILGIISAVAVPKFVSLKRDANIATLEGIKAALSSTATLIEMKAQLEEVSDGSIVIDGKKVSINNSYIAGHWNNAWRHVLMIGKDIDYTKTDAICELNDICAVGNQITHTGLPDGIINGEGGKGLVMFWLEGSFLDDNCYAYYYNPFNGDTPKIGIVDEGC